MLLLLVALLPLAFCQLSDKLAENSINMHTNFHRNQKECNIYDEAVYCQQIVVDRRQSLTAISHKCLCPAGYRCPNDIIDTPSVSQCTFDEERQWHRCQMRCVPAEV